jgi:hypothetical protein
VFKVEDDPAEDFWEIAPDPTVLSYVGDLADSVLASLRRKAIHYCVDFSQTTNSFLLDESLRALCWETRGLLHALYIGRGFHAEDIGRSSSDLPGRYRRTLLCVVRKLFLWT